MIPAALRRALFYLFPFKREDLSSKQRFAHSPLFRWLLLLGTVFTVTAIQTIQFGQIPEVLNVGDIAPRDIRADRRYEIRDEEAIERFTREVETSLRPVYDFNMRHLALSQEVIARIFDKGRDVFSQRLYLQQQNERISKLVKDEGGVLLKDEEVDGFRRTRFTRYYEVLVKRALVQAIGSPILSDVEDMSPYREKGILVRTVGVEGKEGERLEEKLDRIATVARVRGLLPKLDEMRLIDRVPNLKSAVQKLLETMIKPTLTFNSSETEGVRDRALKGMKEVIIRVEPGQMIVRSGDRLESWHVTVLKGIRKLKGEVNMPLKVSSVALLVLICLAVPYSFASRYVKKFAKAPIDLVFLATILVGVIASREFLGGAASLIYDPLLPYGLTLEAFYFMIPVAFGAMLVRLVLNSETALAFALTSTLLVGVHFDIPPTLLLFFLLSQVVGAAAVAYADRRSALLKAGLLTGLIGAATTVILNTIQAAAFLKSFDLSQWSWQAAMALAGGLLASAIVLMLTPLVEVAFNYTTDIKLLELGSLNHPLLRDLLVKAPGTYHHSHITGVLAEAGAQAIGANPLFARVASYYHDIGKMVKAEYFIENQPVGENRHGPLTPHMSALIISSHVREGLELARKHKLPQRVADIIPQHQGTKLMSFFFHKAKTQNEEGEIKEWDFRYEGPKPQTREAGIILLADGVEASARALKDKSPADIREVVRTMINKNFIDGQLDECELTLKDLHQIGESFVRILDGIYHKRIPYPEEASAGLGAESSPLLPQGPARPAEGAASGGGQVLRIPRD